MACRECPALPGCKDSREEKARKGKLVIRAPKECRVQEKGEQGLAGMKGQQGIVGNQGRKGDKGEKGESAKASQASVVPQTNWKQCVWKSANDTDDGKIKVNKDFAG